jgi:hypothetical protein
MGFPCLNKWKIMTNYTNFLLHTPRSPFTTCWFDATLLLNPQQTLITNTPKFLQKICYNTWKQQNSYVVGSNYRFWPNGHVFWIGVLIFKMPCISRRQYYCVNNIPSLHTKGWLFWKRTCHRHHHHPSLASSLVLS